VAIALEPGVMAELVLPGGPAERGQDDGAEAFLGLLGLVGLVCIGNRAA